MARTFASGDKVRCATGNAAPLNGAVTMAVNAKLDASRDGAWRNLLAMLTSGGVWSHGYAFELDNGNKAAFSRDSGATTCLSTTTTTAADGWCLHVVTKVTGSATPRYHRYKYSTGVWVHENMSTTSLDASGEATGLVEIGGTLGSSSDNFVGDIAQAGVFNVALADQDVESLAFTLQAWFGSSKGLWPLDQSTIGQKVVDYSGGGSNESALTGTSVSTNSVPVFNVSDGIFVPTIVTPAGGTTYPISLSGSITPVGTLVKLTAKTLAGGATPVGTIVKQTSKTLAGAVAPTGALAKLIGKVFGGSIAPAGAFSSIVVKAIFLAGSITPSGTLAKTTKKALSGTVAPVGSLAKLIGKTLGGLIAPIGTLINNVFGSGGAPLFTAHAAVTGWTPADARTGWSASRAVNGWTAAGAIA